MLRDELHIAVLEATVFGLVLDAEVGQLQVPADYFQIMRLGEGGPVVNLVGVGRSIRAVQEPLVVALDFIVEDDPESRVCPHARSAVPLS